MRRLSAYFLLVLTGTAWAKDKALPPSMPAQFPRAVYGAIEGSSRFQDHEYSRLFLSDGIKACDPKLLFSLIQDSVRAQENYKALYFARLFTLSQPSVSAGWSNRANIANSLGLREEALASAHRAADASSDVAVPLGVLPVTGLKVHPKTFADWAASMALTGDSVASRQDHFVLAVRDDLGGLNLSDPEEVKKHDAKLIKLGISPQGPYATTKPVPVSLIGPNLFMLKNADPMSYTNTKKGEMFGAFAMTMAAGYTHDPSGSQAAGTMLGDALEVPSNYKGGKYDRVTFSDDGITLLSVTDHPKPSGKKYAVGNPVTILWASGPSLSPMLYGRWQTRIKPSLREAASGKDWDETSKDYTRDPPILYYPKLAALCSTSCSVPVSLMEAILTPADVHKLDPKLVAHLVDLSAQRIDYERDSLTLAPGNSGENLVGFDPSGNTYKIYLRNSQPTGWLVAP